jgi:O-antigen/teichoic acid export membrane protein
LRFAPESRPALVAVFVSPSLAVVIPTAAVAQASGVILVLAVVYRIEGPFSVWAFDRKEARLLLGYGGWISVSNIVSPILASLDQFLIGSIMGVAAVAHYTVPMNLVVRSQMFSGAVARTSFPRMSSSALTARGHWALVRCRRLDMAMRRYVRQQPSSPRRSFAIG